MSQQDTPRSRRPNGQSPGREPLRSGRRGNDLPGELLDVAARAFYESGYVGASLATIATQFGLLKGSLYHYIDSKDDLLFAVISVAHEEATARNVRWRDEPDPLAAITLFVEDHVRTALDNAVYSLVFTNELRHLSADRRHQIIAKRNRYELDLRKLIAAAKENRQLREDIDPKLAALAIFGLINWVCAVYGNDARFDADKVTAQLRRQAVDCLVCG